MNFKEIANLWVQYQNWLKQEGITMDNVQTKIPAFIQKLKENPANAQMLQNAMQSPQGQQLMKMLNLTNEEIFSLTNFSNNSDNLPTISSPLVGNSNRIGNLTNEQMQKIMRKRR